VPNTAPVPDFITDGIDTMSHSPKRKYWMFLAVLAASGSMLAFCTEKKIDFEFTGTAYDKDTKQPIEGAYAVAIYKEIRGGYVAVTSFCVKTKGMYTGKDGKYHFPVEKRNGASPSTVQIIHPDYVWQSANPKPDRIHYQQRAEAYADRDAYMKKQDPANPIFYGHDVWCTEAKKKEDVVAAIEFMKILRAQYVKFNRGQSSLDNLDSMIGDLKEIDERNPRPSVR
jgi:hypothetical protein